MTSRKTVFQTQLKRSTNELTNCECMYKNCTKHMKSHHGEEEVGRKFTPSWLCPLTVVGRGKSLFSWTEWQLVYPELALHPQRQAHRTVIGQPKLHSLEREVGEDRGGIERLWSMGRRKAGNNLCRRSQERDINTKIYVWNTQRKKCRCITHLHSDLVALRNGLGEVRQSSFLNYTPHGTCLNSLRCQILE